MKYLLFLVCVSLVLTGNVASANEATGSLSEAVDVVTRGARDASTGEAALAPIRSKAELATYLQASRETPFSALSARSAKLFVESLVFTEMGLASYRYRELQTELTPRQAYALLSLFGAQRTVGYLRFANATKDDLVAVSKLAPILMDDYKGYRCVPPATCQSAMDHICIGANCGMYTP